ncbi:MAG TPA: DUF2203 domain-containing protein [bacterium]|nr:DUF2203 domain-containing protein [bacterium]HMW37333.1 DUF2203 domain-containing protein [bacterium]HMY36854.1 DUF2203 domain-containing protein [bacterium]HMZ03857.1 DUF2203 domain-containing protein [bacterium]HNB08944.1 DUF2203 domain-containing protein [bacterium]
MSGSVIHNKHYSPEEARILLHDIRVKINTLVALKKHLDEINYNIYKHEYFGGLGPNGSKFHPEELMTLVDILRSLEKQGVIIKSIDEGLIDFPAIRANGEEVYLCWKLGEEDIFYWHTIRDGFQGRRPLSAF